MNQAFEVKTEPYKQIKDLDHARELRQWIKSPFHAVRHAWCRNSPKQVRLRITTCVVISPPLVHDFLIDGLLEDLLGSRRLRRLHQSSNDGQMRPLMP